MAGLRGCLLLCWLLSLYGQAGCEQRIVLGRSHGQGEEDGGLERDGDGLKGLRFALGEQYSAGATPGAILVADLDQDGRPDLIAAHSTGLSLLRGLGGGRFGGAEAIPTGTGPAAVVATDLNRDGRLDLLTADSGDRTLSVLLSAGAGAFRPRTAYPAGAAPASLLATDLDADGWPDAAVTDASADQVVLFRNRADGTGSLAQRIERPAVGRGPVALAAAPLSTQRAVDLVTGNQGTGDASVLRNQGDWTFADSDSYRADGGIRAIALLDLNGDGRLDLAALSDAAVTVLSGFSPGWLFNDKTPERLAVGVGAAALGAGDFDGDGIADLVSANAGAGTVSIVLGSRGQRLPAALHFAAGDGPSAIAVADLDGDGRPDLAMASRSTGRVTVLLNRSQ